MKNFSKFITENPVGNQYAAHLDDGNATNDIANPETVARINGFLGAMGQMEYLMPEHALNLVRERLNQLGLTFDEVALSEGGGKQSMPLKKKSLIPVYQQAF